LGCLWGRHRDRTPVLVARNDLARSPHRRPDICVPRCGGSPGAGPEFDPPLRAAAITIIVMLLDALVVAPFFERSYGMFRSVIGTWLPFVAIFAAAWAAGVLAW
jgi:hypothetical protein